MKHHSEDYKLSAVKYYLKHNQDMRNTCKIFDCKYQSLARWVKTYKKQGNVKRKTRKNKDIKVTPKIVKFIKEYVKKYPTTTLWEFSKIVNKEFKIRLTDKTIYNILHRNKITRKRLRSRYYPEKREGQEKMDLETFYNELKKYDYKKTICLDETSIYLNMTHSYGRSKSGTRVIKRTNKYPYKRYNLLCAISYNKVIGWTLYEYVKGGLTKQDILDFYNHYINDKYKNHLIIMDNARIHVSKIIRETIEKSGNSLLYTVPYHPETNAIEEFFSQLKHYIKRQSPQSFNEIYKTINIIISTKIKSKHLENYIKHAFKIYN
jgi:transposase